MTRPVPDPAMQREFAVEVVRRLRAAGYEALWAGGCVRDLLLGSTPEDYDVATSARTQEVRQIFGFKRTVAVGESFGVVMVLGPRGAGQVEVATFRTEGPYRDGRRPEHVTFATAEEDAQRRDFTINGMFYDPLQDEVRDYVGGQHDLSLRLLRAIGDPEARFREDKLRLLRAVRLASRFNLTVDPTTAHAVRLMAADIPIVSPERIAQELRKMLVHPRRAHAVELARELHVLAVILPELIPLWQSPPISESGRPELPDQTFWGHALRLLEMLTKPSFEVALAALVWSLHRNAGENHSADPGAEHRREAARSICRRLKLSNAETEHIDWLLHQAATVFSAPRLPTCRLKRLLASPGIRFLLMLEQAAAEATPSPQADARRSAVLFCLEKLQTWTAAELNPPPILTGSELIRLGLSPGPAFKDLLEQVRDAQLDGTIQTGEQAQALALRLHGAMRPDTKEP